MKSLKYKRRDEIESENKRLKVENSKLKQQVKTLKDSVEEAIKSINDIRFSDNRESKDV